MEFGSHAFLYDVLLDCYLQALLLKTSFSEYYKIGLTLRISKVPCSLLVIHKEINKTKTREELLAEERDYKRRRMSYRGKKVKRTTLQVRDQVYLIITLIFNSSCLPTYIMTYASFD